MKRLMLALVAVVGAGAVSGLPAPLLASSDTSTIVGKACNYADFLPGCADKQRLDEEAGGQSPFIQRAVNTFLFAAGIVAFIFVIIGGVRYMTSTGDAARIQSAKDTVLYAVIGLIVTILAVPISAFIISASGG